jgi:hypothetical protein
MCSDRITLPIEVFAPRSDGCWLRLREHFVEIGDIRTSVIEQRDTAAKSNGFDGTEDNIVRGELFHLDRSAIESNHG